MQANSSFVWLERLLSAVATVLRVLCGVLLTVITFAIVWQVISRYIAGTSASWAPELASYCFVWLSMFAVALGVNYGAHMKLDIWRSADRRSVRERVLNTGAALGVGAIALAVGWFGLDGLSAAFSATSPSLGVSRGWVALAIPVGMGLSLIFLVGQILASLQGKAPQTGHSASLDEEVVTP